MNAINAAVTAHVEQEVAALKVSLAKARCAAVGWRKRCDAMEIRALSAEGDYECEKTEYEDMTKEWAELEKKLRARAEKAEAELLKVQKADMPARVSEAAEPSLVGAKMLNPERYTNIQNGETVWVLRKYRLADMADIGLYRTVTALKDGETLSGFYDSAEKITFQNPSTMCAHYFTRNGGGKSFDGPSHCFVKRGGKMTNIKEL